MGQCRESINVLSLRGLDMVVGQLIAQILCDGIISLFFLPLFPKKKGKIELESTNESSIIDKSVNKTEWWDVETSEDNKNNIRKNFKKRCKYYFDDLEKGIEGEVRCNNYHMNEGFCEKHSK